MRAAAFVTSLLALLGDRLETRSEKGATAVEYGLLVGLIAVVLIVAVTFLGDTLSDMFTDIGTKLGGTPAEAPVGG